MCCRKMRQVMSTIKHACYKLSAANFHHRDLSPPPDIAISNTSQQHTHWDNFIITRGRGSWSIGSIDRVVYKKQETWSGSIVAIDRVFWKKKQFLLYFGCFLALKWAITTEIVFFNKAWQVKVRKANEAYCSLRRAVYNLYWLRTCHGLICLPSW